MRKYQIIKSSLEYFEEYLEYNQIEEAYKFSELIRWADVAKGNSIEYPKVDILVVKIMTIKVLQMRQIIG